VPKNSKSDSVNSQDYLMESEDEAIRLDVKTDPAALRRQALWSGVKPGMRVLDAGCGSGKTTMLIHEMIQPGGNVVGVDYSQSQIAFAEKNYGGKAGLEFYLQDIKAPMEWLGQFDLVLVRFVLEYYRAGAPEIVKNLMKSVKLGGSLCLMDLDYNSLIYYDMPELLQSTLAKVIVILEDKYNFDTLMGRKLYSFLYDAGFENIEVELMAHNLIYGEIKDKDRFNLTTKIETVLNKLGTTVKSYPGGYDQFKSDFMRFLLDPRRFTYTPLLLCKGNRPGSD
jgi:SAM-dependent methyltransferase